MIVTFDPSIGTTNPSNDARYMNFLRCVTAAATAAAGTTSLTVNPWTSTTAIDSTKNCIISIDSNTEAGGWTTSTGTVAHNVVNSGSFTAISSAGAYNTAGSYKADFYNASGKSAFPYNKLSFHIPVSTTYDNYGQPGPTFPGSWSSYPAICTTIGCSTSIDWTDTGYVPTNGSSNPANTRSWTSGKDQAVPNAPYYVYSGSPIPYMSNFGQGAIKFKIAVTANYCIIWTERYNNDYSTGYNTTQNSYGNFSAWGGFVYMGLRETQPWENSLNFNPPWVGWSFLSRAQTTSQGTYYQNYCTNSVAAWMATVDNAGAISTAGTVKNVKNDYTTGYWQDSSFDSSNQLQTPIFYTRVMDGTTAESRYRGGSTTNIQYPPQVDPVTGVQVPGAYPIVIRSKTSGAWNAGGACRGIYKSLSMPYTTQKLYWTAANQTFNINGEPYIPVVIYEDMWLVRAA